MRDFLRTRGVVVDMVKEQVGQCRGDRAARRAGRVRVAPPAAEAGSVNLRPQPP